MKNLTLTAVVAALAVGFAGTTATASLAAGKAADVGATNTSRDSVARSRPLTMQLGKGLGPYRIGMSRTPHPGLLDTIRKKENDAGGCEAGFVTDSYVDTYRGLRLGYVSYEGKTGLDTIATSTPGDRTTLGYTIGRSTLADVRRRYRNVRVSRHLGGSTIMIHHQTGYESSGDLTYSFNANGTLVALETGVGGC